VIRVFLVDDSPIVTNLVSGYLTGKGFSVSTFNSPFGVTVKMKEVKPEVILMDLGLPGMRGDKLIDLCKKEKESCNCRIILFSSTDDQEMKDLVKKGVAHDYFVKGGALKELEDKIIAQAGVARKKDN
jgi:DNA-binding response OmpR family regulator